MPEKHLAFISLTEDELNHFSYQKADTEGLVNYPLSINGIKFSGFFAEMDGKIKVSFRSKGKFDVNKFAREYFSGGGHINAAGGKSDLNMNETISKFLTIINKPDFKVV